MALLIRSLLEAAVGGPEMFTEPGVVKGRAGAGTLWRVFLAGLCELNARNLKSRFGNFFSECN